MVQLGSRLLGGASGVRAAALPAACRWRHLLGSEAALDSSGADHGRRVCVTGGLLSVHPSSNRTLTPSSLPAVSEMSPTVEGKMCDVLSSYQRLVSKRTSEGQAGYSDSGGDHRTCFPWRILQGSFVEAWRRGAGAT